MTDLFGNPIDEPAAKLVTSFNKPAPPTGNVRTEPATDTPIRPYTVVRESDTVTWILTYEQHAK